MLLRPNAETRRQDLELERLPGLLHGGENLVATGDLVLVTAFAGGVRILRAARHQKQPRGSKDRLTIEVILAEAARVRSQARRGLTALGAVSTFLALRSRCPGGGIGRRAGFRCQWGNTRGGSSPLLGTRFITRAVAHSHEPVNAAGILDDRNFTYVVVNDRPGDLHLVRLR